MSRAILRQVPINTNTTMKQVLKSNGDVVLKVNFRLHKLAPRLAAIAFAKEKKQKNYSTVTKTTRLICREHSSASCVRCSEAPDSQNEEENKFVRFNFLYSRLFSFLFYLNIF